MGRHEQHDWGRESRRDGSSEWPSTGFSTMNGEPSKAVPARPRRRIKKSSFLALAVPIMLTLSCGAVGVIALANHLRG